MQVVGVAVGGETDAERVMERLAEAVASAGEVAVVRARERRVEAVSNPVTAVAVDAGAGTLTLPTATDAPLEEALDWLTERGVAYALVEADLAPARPHVAVGEVDGAALAGAVVHRTTAENIDDEAVLEAIEAVEPHVTLASLIERIQTHPDAPKAGAIATFTGRVRADNVPGHTTARLEYEKYEGVADRELAAIERELTDREGIVDVLLHHHTGVVEAGEDAVYVVVLAGHREEAFAAVSDGIDLLKERVPIFKKEVTESGEFWAHDRP